ncbi:MAG: dihydroorotase [Candidatus Asgardarchaeia archaeon]
MGTVDLLIENVKVPTEDGLTTANVFIDSGKVLKIKKTPQGPTPDYRIIADRLLLIPGVIDAHVHFRDFDLAYKEDFYTGSCAAAAGGVTSILDMPNTRPRINSAFLLDKRIKVAEHKSIINFGFHLDIPRTELAKEFAEAVELGLHSIKIYSYEHENYANVLDNVMRAIAEKKLNLRICVHVEDLKTIKENEKQYESNVKDLEYHNLVRSESAEAIALKETIEVLKKYNIPTHICHVSSQISLKLIEDAKKKKLPITAEVTPHHLLLNLDDVKKLGPIGKTNPPIRPKATQLSLLAALIRGVFDIVASDHAPHTLREKEEGQGDIRYAPSGVVGVETLLPLIFNLVSKDIISFSTFLELLVFNPIKIFKIKNKGGIASGFDADFTIIDPKEEWVIKGENLHGRTKFTPFEGYKVRGNVVYTIVNGKLVYERGEIVGRPGTGKYLYEAE